MQRSCNVSFNTSQEVKDNTTIIFTSLHGTSIIAVPETLKQAGYNNVHIVKEKEVPDVDFPSVASPNPE